MLNSVVKSLLLLRKKTENTFFVYIMYYDRVYILKQSVQCYTYPNKLFAKSIVMNCCFEITIRSCYVYVMNVQWRYFQRLNSRFSFSQPKVWRSCLHRTLKCIWFQCNIQQNRTNILFKTADCAQYKTCMHAWKIVIKIIYYEGECCVCLYTHWMSF